MLSTLKTFMDHQKALLAAVRTTLTYCAVCGAKLTTSGVPEPGQLATVDQLLPLLETSTSYPAAKSAGELGASIWISSKVCGLPMLTVYVMPTAWPSSELKRVESVPFTALVMAFWGESPVLDGVLLLAVKPDSFSCLAPNGDAAQSCPATVLAPTIGWPTRSSRPPRWRR